MQQILNEYFSFNGRLNRWRYFTYVLPLRVIVLFPYVIAAIYDTRITQADLWTAVIISISIITLSVRRLHDLNKSGLFVLIQVFSFIPVINIIAFNTSFCLYYYFQSPFLSLRSGTNRHENT